MSAFLWDVQCWPSHNLIKTNKKSILFQRELRAAYGLIDCLLNGLQPSEKTALFGDLVSVEYFYLIIIIIISLTFCLTCCMIFFFCKHVKSVFTSGWGCWCASQPREWAHCRLSWGFAFFVTFNFDSLLFFSFLFTFQTGLPVLHRVSGLHLWLPARWRKSGRGYRKLVRTVFVLFLSNK